MTKQEIIDAAMQLAAGIGNDVQNSPLIDADMTANDLFLLAARYVIKNNLASRDGLQDVSRTFTVAVSLDNLGTLSGELPPDLVVEGLDQALLPDYPFSSMSPTIMDFQRQKYDNLLCYWVVHNNKFYTTCGQAEDAEDNVTGVDIFAPGLPEMPVGPTQDINATPDFIDKWIYVLAMALRGEIRLEGGR